MKRTLGFLLIEVLLSVVILTSGLLVIVRSYYVTGKMLERSESLFRTGLLAEEMMFGPEDSGTVQEGTTAGNCLTSPEDTWSLEVTPASTAAWDKGLSRVSMTVTLDHRPASAFGITTYLAKKS